MYDVRKANLKEMRKRVSKTMLHNKKNRTEAAERYKKTLPELLAITKNTRKEEAQEMFKEVTRTLTEPWSKMVERKKKFRFPHWNAKLHTLWEAMQKARLRAKRSGL